MLFPSITTRIGDFTYDVEYPEPEDLAEGIEFCGGEVGALNLMRSAIKQNATQGPKDKVRKALNSDADVESAEFLEILSKGQAQSRGYQPTGRRSGALPGQVTQREALAAIMAEAEADPGAFAELIAKHSPGV